MIALVHGIQEHQPRQQGAYSGNTLIGGERVPHPIRLRELHCHGANQQSLLGYELLFLIILFRGPLLTHPANPNAGPVDISLTILHFVQCVLT